MVDRSHALRGNASRDALCHPCTGCESGRGAAQAAFPRGAWERSAPTQPTADRGRNGLGEGFLYDRVTAR
ncbi:DUF1534 domain-containing protein [Pseudomonas fluorescens]|nr:DUF1534 domain-containing protein [Pseudomonas fluorescens]